MPRYTYSAKTAPDKTTQGYIEAESEQDAINRLTQMGYFPLSVRYETTALEKHGLMTLRKISNREIALFTRQLASLIESGVNILNALNIIAGQTTNSNLAVILNDVSGRIKDGKSLSESLAAFPILFTNLYCAMIRSGEASGEMNIALKRLADFLEEQEEFKNSLKASLTYPLFVFTISVLTVIVLLVFVIPKLVTMFQDMGQVLPLPTRILIAVSGFMRSYWLILLAAICILVFLIRRVLRSPNGKEAWDALQLRIVFLSNIVSKTEISRLTRTLSLLLSSGLPITPALDISASIMDNQILKSEVSRFKDEIASGGSLSSSLKKSSFFPAFVTNIIAIGEETGSLDKSLMRIAVDYEREVNRTLSGLTRLIEPVIILVMGLIVGFIVISMLLPIFQINLIVK